MKKLALALLTLILWCPYSFAQQPSEASTQEGTLMTVVIAPPELTPPPPPQEFTLQFQLEDSLHYRTETSKTIRKLKGNTQQVDKNIVYSRVLIKKTNTGFDLTTTTEKMETFVNNQPVTNILDGLMQKTPITMSIDPRGKIIRQDGYVALTDMINKKYRPSKTKNAASGIDVDLLAKTAAEEWDSRINNLVGRKIKAGDRWIESHEYIFPDGSKTPYYALVTVLRPKKCGDLPCVRIGFTYANNAEDFKSVLAKDEPLPELPEQVEIQNEHPAEIFGRGERVLEPDTMIVHNEDLVLTIKTIEQNKDQTQTPVTVTEKKSYNCDFRPIK